MTSLEKQKPYKPKIYDIIGELLDGDNLNIALEFIAFLKENKISIQWTNVNTWKATSKGKVVCYIKAGVERDTGATCYTKFVDGKGSWVIQPSIDGFDNYVIFDNIGYNEIISDKDKFNLICSKVRSCTNCGNLKKCAPGMTVNMWGTELTNRCKFFGVPFLDPDRKELECVKLLICIFRKSLTK